MKNLKIVNMKKFIRSVGLLIAIVIAIIFLFSKTTSSHNEKNQTTYDTIAVCQGDTLWQISLEQQQNNPYYTNKDVREIVNHIKHLNQIEGANLWVGQELKVPAM